MLPELPEKLKTMQGPELRQWLVCMQDALAATLAVVGSGICWLAAGPGRLRGPCRLLH